MPTYALSHYKQLISLRAEAPVCPNLLPIGWILMALSSSSLT
jgi:hypothetical protein